MFNKLIRVIIYIIAFIIILNIFNDYIQENLSGNKDKPIQHTKFNSFNEFGITKIIPLLDDPKWTKYVDKLLYKKECDKYNIKTFKTLHILDKPNDLYNLYKNLPNYFIVKCNKGSGKNFIVTNKNKTLPKDIINKLSNYNDPYHPFEEPQYEYTKSQLYIEEYIDPIPPDIKIFLYNKKPTIMYIETGRFNNISKTIYHIDNNNKLTRLYNEYWNGTDSNKKDIILNEIIEQNKLDDLLNKSQIFNIDIPLVRVDFYWYKNDIYGGEITLSSGNFKQIISDTCAKLCLQ